MLTDLLKLLSTWKKKLDNSNSSDNCRTRDNNHTTEDDNKYTRFFRIGVLFIERSLDVKVRGDKFHVDVTPDAVDESSKEANIFEIQKDKFSNNMTIKPGTGFKAALRGGIKFFTIKDIIENIITVDGMYPYVDKTISFDIEILDIKE